MAYNLDLKDKKILKELDFDARQSYSGIGRNVGLSKQVVEYRINNLLKEEIIKGFYPVVNVPKLRYFYCRLAFTLQNISPQEFKNIIDDIKKDERVFWIFEMQGSVDLFFGSWFKTLNEFREFIDHFMGKYSKFVKERIENIATDVIHYEHRYLLNKKETREIHIAESKDSIEIDELDKKILTQLCIDGRMSLVEMGIKLKEHPKTLAYRISRMEKTKLIEGYRAIIDHNKLGYTYYKIFLNINNFTSKDKLRLKEYIKRHPATIYYIEGIALHDDIDFEMMIKNNQELFEFIKVLREEFPKIIGSYTTAIFMNTLKVRYLPF